ncbi:MAG: DUF72 domain-containing protein [bacterium]
MVKIGTSGYSFPDWRGTVYPQKIRPEELLIFYQESLGFDCVEINSTYYSLLSEKTVSGMERKAGDGFEFVIKGYRGFTHDPFDSRLGIKKPEIDKALDDADKFVYSIQPIKSKLGAVLLQFPFFFRPSSQSMDYILRLKEKFLDMPVVAEFRSRDWAVSETFSFLKNNKIAYCVVDEPKLFQLMPLINVVTSNLSYLRLHGRNRNWFNAPVSERYNYLYQEKELRSFIPEIEKMSGESEKTYVFFNNCHMGQAVKNAVTLKELMGLIGQKENGKIRPV